tara:strand:+ start:5848 stop:7086 length:1239 start_codon:yes stop_codon:yes gene_type:complete
MGEIFLSNSGNRKFQMFWYECPITKKRRKKQVEITKKLPAAAAYIKAAKLQKELERSFDDGNYSAEDKPFLFALDSLEKIYLIKWELHQKDPTTGLRERTYNEYLGFLEVIRGDSNHQLKIRDKKIADYKCSQITPEIADEISALFAKKLNKNLNPKCWAKFEAACKLAVVKNFGMKINPCVMVDRSNHQSKQRVIKTKAPTKQEVDSFLDYLEQRKNKGSNSCQRKDFTMKFDYIYNLYSAHTGKRGCEVLATNINDVDIHKGVVDVNKSLCAKTGNIEMTKTDKSERLVALTDRLAQGIKEWVAYLNNKEIPNPKRILFPAMNGNYKNASNVLNRSIKKNVIDFGLDPAKFSPHQYRRHNNSRRKEAGHNSDRLKNQLGHEDDKMSNLYNTTWEDVKKDRQDVNQAFSNG